MIFADSYLYYFLRNMIAFKKDTDKIKLTSNINLNFFYGNFLKMFKCQSTNYALSYIILNCSLMSLSGEFLNFSYSE